MSKINMSAFPFQFFLNDFQVVSSLHEGALKNGGATKFGDTIISNVSSGDLVQINDTNSLSILIPSTINVNEVIDNSSYVSDIRSRLSHYGRENIKYYATKGSWYSDDLSQVVEEDITVVTVDLSRKVNAMDIMYFVALARLIKKSMSQEGVSIYINNALAIV